ncbi:Diaminopimelate decarboxylase [Granulibacter bethesdensis]|uniref:Diaminopimelate decarboxylase n=2 Tax=Granulibacter bethesdensis TaxID=364410 RepID=Q0BVX5_GRABC|nr:Diaminopimelate decarboxylase [Granulibacter bethesdensis CGDNIH1]AHJ67117.1 Diaminopimelate decarboxylase [Granulibacter bethesdensis]APH50802.1 Diaminopimelate decarboxylase [Granulibacter bethesdensis]APH63496.1 Diaminopimelate decarboxylase [Granulibacter bethesdensis]
MMDMHVTDTDRPDPSVMELIAARPSLSMHAMDGLLLDDVPLNAIADAQGTPCWVYSAGTFRRRYRLLRDALAEAGIAPHIHFAVKANDHLAVLRLLGNEGAGADVVSGGELSRARAAGIPGERIVFSGVGKTAAELTLALSEGIAQINVESAEELEMLSAIACGMGRTARIALRVNPDVDAGTHPKITTGLADNKFGIQAGDVPALYARAASLPGIEPVGLAMHIGSQINVMTPFLAAFRRMAILVQALRDQGLTVRLVDCGGGLGIDYRGDVTSTPAALAGAMKAELGGLDVQLVLEPGRWLAGPAGVLLSSVVLVKQSRPRPFVVLDAAMNDLLRPSLYEAWHGIVPLSAVEAAHMPIDCDVVGPVCETGDTFARSRSLPPLQGGSRVAILEAGAYGAVMSSTYNARPLAAQVLVDDGHWAVIRPRQTVDALWRDEVIPPHLTRQG